MKQALERPSKKRELPLELEWLRHYARIMDDWFQIPGTKFRIGLDPLVGIIPWLGDIISGTISGLILLIIIRHGVSREVILRLTGNFLLDYLLGSIPLLGDLIDAGFHANRRNLRLLEQFWNEGKYQGNGSGWLLLALAALAGAILLTAWVIWKILYWLGSIFF